MKTCIAFLLTLSCLAGHAQTPPAVAAQASAAYPESESTAAWRALAAGYVRKALAERRLVTDPALNARIDTVMAGVGRSAGSIDARYTGAEWRALLIEDFGRGAVAFPGGIILVDAKFVRSLALSDDELALVLAHEVAHVLAGHAHQKLAFMAETLGREKAPTAQAALNEFIAHDEYAHAFRRATRLQEREADLLGAGILFASDFDAQGALALFDKLERFEAAGPRDTHDSAAQRKLSVSVVLEDLRRSLGGGTARR
jgi:predicted Zn-dependent protease